MSGVIDYGASLSCTGTGAFEQTEGLADATEHTDLAFLHQGKSGIRRKLSTGRSTHRCLASQRAARWLRPERMTENVFVMQFNPESRPDVA